MNGSENIVGRRGSGVGRVVILRQIIVNCLFVTGVYSICVQRENVYLETVLESIV